MLLLLLKLNNSVKNYSFQNSFTPIQNRSDRIYVKCHWSMFMQLFTPKIGCRKREAISERADFY